MAERPEHELGPQQQATIYLPAEMWRAIRSQAVTHDVSASAILTELVATHLETSPNDQAIIADRAKRWMRPKGGAARGEGDAP